MRDLFRPGGGESRLTWRLVGNLIRHLPPESATKTALRNEMSDAEMERASKGADPSQGAWSQTEMLLASLIDSVRWLIHVTLRVNGGKGGPPAPVPRPGVKKTGRRKRELTPAQLDAMWHRINGGRIEGTVVGSGAEAATVRSTKPVPQGASQGA
ncbi:hypothetical protein [Streptosporangium sp. NPDC004631]